MIIKPHYFRFKVGLILATMFLSLPAAPLTIKHSRPGALLFEFRVDSVWVDENNQIHTSPTLTPYQVPGYPRLPYVAEVLLDVPEDARVEVYSSPARQIPGITVPLTEGELAKGMALQKPVVPWEGGAFPNQVVRLQKTVSIKGHPAVVLELFPLRFSQGTLVWNRHLTVQIRWQPRGRRRAALLSQTDLATLQSPARARTPNMRLQIPPYQFSQHIARIEVDTVGWFVLSSATLLDSGLDVVGVDPRTFRLWNLEQELPLYVEGQDDGHFDPGDRMVFFGEPAPPPPGVDYKMNFYTQNNVYWLTWGTDWGKRYIAENAYPSVDPGQVYRPTDYRFTRHVERNDYFARLGSSGLHQQWDTFEHFFMEPPIQGGTQVNFPFKLFSPKPEATSLFDITLRFQGMTTGSHAVQINLNGYQLLNDAWGGQTAHIVQSVNNPSLLNTFLNDGPNSLSISLAGDPANPYDQVYLDWVEVTYDRLYQAHDDYLQFHREGSFPVLTQFEISGFTSADIWLFKESLSRLTDFLVLYSPGVGTYRIVFQDFVDSDTTDYQAFTEAWLKPVKSLAQVPPLTMPLVVGGASYLALGPDSFQTVLDLLVTAREGVFIDVEEVYREYSGGVVSPYAIRDFLADVYWYWQPRPKAVLLAQQGKWFGWEGGGNAPAHFLPAMKIQTVGFGAVASDYWYACVAGEDLLPDFAVGRIPARTIAELDQVVQKTLQMSAADTPPWTNSALLIGGYETTFKDQSEVLINSLVGKGFFPSRLYVDQYSEGGPFYGSTDDLIAYLNEGRIWVNFLGHGGGAVWGDRSLLTLGDLEDLNNVMTQPLVTSMTCFTGDVTNPNSLGRRMVLKEGGGAAAWVGSAGVGWIINDFLLLQPFADQLLERRETSVGSLLNTAKVMYLASNNTFPDIARSQIYQYNLIGDPALAIPFPEETALNLDPPVAELGSALNLAPLNGSPEALTVQLFDDRNYPVTANPTLLEGVPPYTLNLPDTLNSSWFTVNTTFAIDQTVYQANDTVFTPRPVARILSIEPQQPTVLDSINVLASLIDTVGVGVVELWMRRYDAATRDWIDLFIAEMDYREGSYRPRHQVPPQTVYLEWQLYCRVRDLDGQTYLGPLFPLQIQELPNIRPVDVQFFVDQGLGLEAIIDHSSMNFDAVVVTFQRKTAGGWQPVGEDTLEYTPGSLVARINSVFPRGIYTYRVIATTPTFQSDVTDDTLYKILETNAFWVTKSLGTTEDLQNHTPVGISGVEINIPGGVTSEDYILNIHSLDEVRLPYQPNFTIVKLDSLRSGIQITSRPEVPYSVGWSLQNSIPDSARLYQYYEPVELWLPVEEYDQEDQEVRFQGEGALQVAWITGEDLEPPILEAMLNGQRFLDESYVNTTPVITVVAQDRNGIDCRLDKVQFWVNGQRRNLTGAMNVSGKGSQVGLQLTPTLSRSDSSISLVVADAAGNLSDTLNLTFQVWEQMKLIDYGNFPNPFIDKTVFAYELTETVDHFSLKIYSLDGRLIWEVASGAMVTALDPRIGAFHEIVWDGRDKGGSFVANGVYFYQMVAKQGKQVIKKQGKVAKAR